jgi:sec-independent protein translocase protein TatA
MEALSLPHLLIIFLIVVIFFGGRRIPEVMRGLGEGIRSFREGMNGPADNPAAAPPPANTPSAEPKQ